MSDIASVVRLAVMSSTPPDGRTVVAPTTPSNVVPLRPEPKRPPHLARLRDAAHAFAVRALSDGGTVDPQSVSLASQVFASITSAAAGSAELMGLPPWHALTRELRASLLGAEITTALRGRMAECADDDDTTRMDGAVSMGSCLSALALVFVGQGHSDVQ